MPSILDCLRCIYDHIVESNLRLYTRICPDITVILDIFNTVYDVLYQPNWTIVDILIQHPNEDISLH